MIKARRVPEIAIIGMSARFAGAPDIEKYWHNILDGVDCITEACDRWASPYFDPDSSANDRIYTRKGGFIGATVAFDPSEHGIMPSTIASADVDHFLALAHARNALADAGYDRRPFDRKRTGVILGRGTYVNRGYNTLLQHGQTVDQILDLVRSLNPEVKHESLEKLRAALKSTLPPFSGEVVANLVPNVITGRIANRLDLMGTNYIVDAACASSLIAIGQAIEELRNDRCDMMLTGAVHSTTPPQLYMMFCQLNGMSRTRLRPFDLAADGTLLGEGIGILVLKRLSDAERDGDRVYALIKAVGTSSDGRALGLLAPRSEGQIAALDRAYAASDVAPSTVELIEAHGTGMPLGDKTEIESLAAFFGGRQAAAPQVAVGSVKSMIGHCIPAAGVAGVIKATLALHDKVLPPSLCETVNPGLGIEPTTLYINNRTRPWVHGGDSPRRAGVDAFGFGGVNAHAVLEEYRVALGARQLHAEWPSELLLFAADERDGLVAELHRVRDFMAGPAPPALADLAYSLSRRAAGAHRAAIVCSDPAALGARLTSIADALGSGRRGPNRGEFYFGRAGSDHENRGVAFLFPGEGGQYSDMLADLCVHIPLIREWFDLLDQALAETSSVLPSRVIFPAPTGLTSSERATLGAQLMTLELGSAAVFTASMALHSLLSLCGVRADAMVGHSTGEGAALVASGIVRLADRDGLAAGVARFNRVYRELTESGRIARGALVTVGAADPALIADVVAGGEGELHVALENCPNQTVLFGRIEQAEAAISRLTKAGAVCLPLPFDRAYHTPLLQGLAPAVRKLYDELDVGPGRVPVYSCTTTEPFPEEAERIRALATRQWFSCVQFRQTVEKLYESGVRIFVEVGPGAKLTGFVRDTLKLRHHLALSSNVQNKPALAQFQQVLAQLFVAGIEPDLAPLFAHRPVREISLEPPAKTPARRKCVELDMLMPVMRLTETASRELREELLPRLPAKDSPPGSPSRLAAETELSMADVRLQGVRAHFDLMQVFLASQGRVWARLGAAAQPAAVSPREASPGARWPLMRDVVEHSAEVFVCDCRVTIARDLFLRDHTLGRAPSADDPDLLPLAVVPFAVSMEMVAEAACCLFENRGRVVRLYNLRGYRWLALDQAEISLRVRAEATTPGAGAAAAALVRIFVSGGVGPDGMELVFEGRADLAATFPSAPVPLPFDVGASHPVHYTREMLYGEVRRENMRHAGLFHGPQFQGVVGLRRCGKDGIEADVEVLSRNGLFKDLSEPGLATDPALLDAAGQLLGYWVAERFGVDLSFFPFAVADYRQYAVPLPAGSRLVCRAAIRMVSPDARPAGFEFLDRAGKSIVRLPADGDGPFASPSQYETCRLFPANGHLEADFEFVSPHGAVYARLLGWSDRYFSISHRYYRCQLWPQREFFSEPWLQPETGRICRRIEIESEAYLEQGWGIWKRALAHLVLSREERLLWYALPGKGARRTEWLLGRIAAKDAVRQWSAHRLGLHLAPADVEILPDGLNRPLVRCGVLTSRRLLPDVSISHTASAVVAAVSEPATQIGIDLADLKQVRSVEAVKRAFSDWELDLLGRGTASEEAARVLAFWCAKEAASKAHGSGLGGEPRDWLIDDYAADSGLVTVTHDRASYRVRVWRLGNEVLAIC
jgi:acyl transferase domain-containing protein/phosphopantetheinyl transferase (holo-ACP synthase)